MSPKLPQAHALGGALLRPRGSNQGSLRQFNDRAVLQAIRVHGSLPKAELARVTGLSAQTVGLIVARLDADGLLIRQPRVRGRIGQPSVPISLNPDGAYAIGIKIGRRSTDCLLVDFTGQVRARISESYAFPVATSLLPGIRAHLRQMQRSLRGQAKRLVGIGVAAPLLLGGWHRMMGLSEAESTTWNQLDLRAAVQQMTKLPVSFAKDTTAACVAELTAGRGRDVKSFLYLFIDTFVGGGLVLHSQLHAGAHGNAGAVASLPVGGMRGAGTALAEQLVAHASLWDLERRFDANGLEPLAAYDERALEPAYLPATLVWLARAAQGLAQCIVSGMAFLDMDAVVLDGSCARPLLARLIDETRKAVLACNREGLWDPEILVGQIGSDARALGGALLPLHDQFAPERDVFLKD